MKNHLNLLMIAIVALCFWGYWCLQNEMDLIFPKSREDVIVDSSGMDEHQHKILSICNAHQKQINDKRQQSCRTNLTLAGLHHPNLLNALLGQAFMKKEELTDDWNSAPVTEP